MHNSILFLLLLRNKLYIYCKHYIHFLDGIFFFNEIILTINADSYMCVILINV